jgi:hypothetical protein
VSSARPSEPEPAIAASAARAALTLFTRG